MSKGSPMAKKDDDKSDNSDIVQMIIAMQEKSNSAKRSAIVVSPMVAITSLVGIIIVLVQVTLGIGMWTIGDKLTRYDSYEGRISNLETAVVKLENLPIAVEKLSNNFDQFIKEPKPILDSLSRIESTVTDKVVQTNKSLDDNIKKIDEIDKRLYNAERDIDVLTRLKK